jgi:hypothetical protein
LGAGLSWIAANIDVVYKVFEMRLAFIEPMFQKLLFDDTVSKASCHGLFWASLAFQPSRGLPWRTSLTTSTRLGLNWATAFGDAFTAPRRCTHGVVALEDGSMLLDQFSPQPDDYL